MLVDSASSQKINSTLRWLVNNHGTLTGNQAIVVWAIKRPEEKPVLNPQSGSFDFDDSFSSIADESKALHDDISDALNATNVQYAKIFSRVLRGYEGAEDLKKHNDPMVVVILDAATTGRLGVTFYCELQKDEYIKRILQWHVDAAWPLTSFWNSTMTCFSVRRTVMVKEAIRIAQFGEGRRERRLLMICYPSTNVIDLNSRILREESTVCALLRLFRRLAITSM